jgi:hypothetical protein
MSIGVTRLSGASVMFVGPISLPGVFCDVPWVYSFVWGFSVMFLGFIRLSGDFL